MMSDISPALTCALVTPNDGADLTRATKGFSFAVAGTVKVTTAQGDTVVITSGSLAAGIIHPLAVKRIWSTSTTATGIVAFYD